MKMNSIQIIHLTHWSIHKSLLLCRYERLQHTHLLWLCRFGSASESGSCSCSCCFFHFPTQKSLCEMKKIRKSIVNRMQATKQAKCFIVLKMVDKLFGRMVSFWLRAQNDNIQNFTIYGHFNKEILL